MKMNSAVLSLGLYIAIFLLLPISGQAEEKQTSRCSESATQAGCIITDLVVGGEVDFDGNHAYGLRGGVGAFIVDDLALTIDVGPIWTSTNQTRLDMGVRGRYFLDVNRPYRIALGYWVGMFRYLDGGSGNAVRHVPEFSFIGEFNDHLLFGMYVGLPISHDNGTTKVGASFLPTLSVTF